MRWQQNPAVTCKLISVLLLLAACSAQEESADKAEAETPVTDSEPVAEAPEGGEVVGYIDADGNFVPVGQAPEIDANTVASGSYSSGAYGGSGAYGPIIVDSLEEARALGPGRYVDREGREIIIEPPIAKPEVEYADGGTYELPSFPWPPERPSSRMRLERRGILAGEDLSLLEVEDILSLALMEAGYYEQSFYAVPGGFALVTRLEGIDADGVPLSNDLRYLLSDEARPFSLKDFVGNLFFAPEGYYRFVTFIVSNQPFMTAGTGLTEEAALSRLQEGGSALPESYSGSSFSSRHNIDALIYEYRKSASADEPELLTPGRLSPQTHMANSGVAAAWSAAIIQ